MPNTLNARLGLMVNAAYAASADLGTVQHDIAWTPGWVLSDGTGANQAKAVFADTRTLAASANESLDLAGGLTDAFGNALTFTKIKGLVVLADPANTNDVLVGGAASNAIASLFGSADDVVRVKPGGAMMLMAPDANGYAVTAGTGDLLRIANSAGSTPVTYTLAVIGVA